MSELFGWIGNVGIVLGILSLTRKNIAGFFFNTFGNLMYVFQAAVMDNYSLFAISVFLIAVNFYGIYKWGQHESV